MENNTGMIQDDIEIMAPAGSHEAVSAALQAGADAIYFGVGNLNMRSRSTVNFTLEEMAQITERCQRHGTKCYLTVNTIVYPVLPLLGIKAGGPVTVQIVAVVGGTVVATAVILEV